MTLRLLRPLLAALLVSCGAESTLGGPCQSTCDCKATHAPVRCPGEWTCNLQKQCQYNCKGTCAAGAPYTCRDGEECNGSICSERLTCG